MEFFIAQWANSTKWFLVVKSNDSYTILPGKSATIAAATAEAYKIARRDGVKAADVTVEVKQGTRFLRQIREQKMGPTYETTQD